MKVAVPGQAQDFVDVNEWHVATCGEQTVAWPPLYSQPSHAAAPAGCPRLAAASVVISTDASLLPPSDSVSQQWSSDTYMQTRLCCFWLAIVSF